MAKKLKLCPDVIGGAYHMKRGYQYGPYSMAVNDVKPRLGLFLIFCILFTRSIYNLHALFLGELTVAYMEVNTSRHLFYNYSL